MSHNFDTVNAQPALIQAKLDLYHELLSDSITLAANISELSGDSVSSSTTDGVVTKTKPNESTDGSIGSRIDLKWDDFVIGVQELKTVINTLRSGHPKSLDKLLPKINNFARLELDQADIDAVNYDVFPRITRGSRIYQRTSRAYVEPDPVSDPPQHAPPTFTIGTVYDIRDNIVVVHPVDDPTVSSLPLTQNFELSNNTDTTDSNYYNDQISVVLRGEQNPVMVTSGMVETSNGNFVPTDGTFLSTTSSLNMPGQIKVLSLRDHDGTAGSQTVHKPAIDITTNVNTINNTVQTKVTEYTNNHNSIFGDTSNPSNIVNGIIQNMQSLVRKASIAISYFQALPTAEQKLLGFKDPVLTTLHTLITTAALFPEVSSGVFSSGNTFLDALHTVSKDKTTLFTLKETNADGVILLDDNGDEIKTTSIDSETRSSSYSEAIIGLNGLESPNGIDRLNTLLSTLTSTITALDNAIKTIEIDETRRGILSERLGTGIFNYGNVSPINIAKDSLWNLLDA